MLSPDRIIVQNLLSQMRSLLEGDLWFGTTSLARLKQITPGESVQPPTKGVHCIQQILMHMDAWRDVLVERLQGKANAEISIDSAKDWTPQADCKAEDWPALIDRFASNYRKMLTLIEEKGVDAFRNRAGKANYDFRFIMEGILHHDLYHLGQIAIIHKIVKT